MTDETKPNLTVVDYPRTKVAADERERGKDAAHGGVELEALCTWPSLDYMIGYFGARFHNEQLGLVLARVQRECVLWEMEEVLTAIRELPAGAINALNCALVEVARPPGQGAGEPPGSAA
jgi:hypothetical protein